TLDAVLPTVTITGPTAAPTYVTATTPMALGGTMSDNLAVASVAWSTTGAVGTTSGTATLGAGTWTVAAIDLALGVQTITVTATDTAGNISTDVVTVTLDTTLP